MGSPKLRFKEFIGDWESIKLSDFSEIITSGSRDWAKYYTNDGDKFIRMTNLVRDGIRLNLDDLKFVKLPESSTEGTRSSLQYGDILISITAELGKLGWIPKNLGSAYINQHTALVRLNNQINSKFVAYLLSTTEYNNKLNGLNDAGAKAGLNLSTIRQFKIKIPSKVEQTKIVNFLTAVDEKISQLNEQHQLMLQYKKGVMQKIFSQEIRFKDDNGEEFGEWEERTLGDVVDVFDNLRVPVTSSERIAGKTPYYGANGIQDYVEGYTHKGEFVLLAEDGANDLINYPICYVNGQIWVNNHAHALSGKSGVLNNRFLTYRITSMNISNYLVGGGRAKLNGSTMKTIKLYLPTFKEQTEIANFLTSIDDKINNLFEQLQIVKQWKKGLLQQMFV